MSISVQRLLLTGVALVVGACGNGLLAVSARAEGCSNERLRAEQPYGLGLPDCRADEMVSPLDKNDNNVLNGHARASVSGEGIVYSSVGAFAEPPAQPGSTLYEDRYIARRGTNGWSTQNINPPYTPFGGSFPAPYGELVFTPDLSKGLMRLPVSPPLASGALKGLPNLYIGDIATGSYQAVTTVNLEGEPFGFSNVFYPIVVGASTDFSHVVFEHAGEGKFHVYEWVNGQLSMVDVPPEGQTFSGENGAGAPINTERIGAFSGDEWHAVSTDASRVFFTGAEPGKYIYPGSGSEEEGAGQLYMREVNAAKTIEVSASQRASADPNGPQWARFWTASADGSRVFFTSKEELTEDANTGSADNATNLYEYNVESGVLTDLSVDANAGDVNGAEVLGLVTASEDGSYVYFVAEGNLASGATSGQANLYLYHGGKVTFIATLVNGPHESSNQGDEGDWSRDDRFESSGDGGPGMHTARVTPDGRYLAFESKASLTGYDNEPAESGECGYENNEQKIGPQPCNEVYLFDAETGSLTCVSCNPSGAQPVGSSNLGGHETSLEEASLEVSQYYLQRNLSEDGSRLFFQSQDTLLPHASNGRQNVYEYENGHVYLISDGAGSYDSYFLDASPNGNDVFIATADQLLPGDQDHYVDVYDARVGGGFPVSASAPECDNGDSCKPPVSSQPTLFGAPASGTFSGAGNTTSLSPAKRVVRSKSKSKSKRCRKGSVAKHGRCVKQRGKRSTAKGRGGR